MILEKYKHFNVEEYIKSLRSLHKRRETLQEELDILLELPAVDNKSGVRSSTISNLTETQALKRIEISSEIADIDLCLSAYDYAKSRLDKDEREVIELFFEPSKPIWRGVDDFAQAHYMCRRNVYRARRKALAKMEDIITEKYL